MSVCTPALPQESGEQKADVWGNGENDTTGLIIFQAWQRAFNAFWLRVNQRARANLPFFPSRKQPYWHLKTQECLMKSEALLSRRHLNFFIFTAALTLFTTGYTPSAHSADSKPVKIAVYRGEAGCEGCSEMVVKSLINTGLKLSISYMGENEKLTLNRQNLKGFDLYIQPGGGQDIPAAYDAIGDEGADAIRDFVRSGKGYLGICMGAYLADKDWIGLINPPLDSEAGRPGAEANDEGDYTLSVKWGGKEESFYYQDGPYLSNSAESPGYTPIAYYLNGDVAMAAYTFGKGKVVLTGPHPEADESWIDASKPGYIPAASKMTRLLKYLDPQKD